MKIVSVEQMQEIERSADALGLSYETMMQHAGRGIADWLLQHVSMTWGVVGLVGSGNNGGDTIIALTWLAKWGLRTAAFLVKDRGADPLLDEYHRQGGAVVDISSNENLDKFEASLLPGTVLVDGILGTGLKLPLSGSLFTVMVKLHKLTQKRTDLLRIAVDCPSGVDCNTGEVSEVTIPADQTLTMAAMKMGLLRHPARTYAGELHLIGIGIDDLSEHISADLPVMIDQSTIKGIFPNRSDHGHKGTFGTCLVLAGSPSYTGAAYLTGKSAYRAGCGLVNMAVTREVQHSLAGRLIEAVWTIMPNKDESFDLSGIETLQGILPAVDALVIGPGWGLNENNAQFLVSLLKRIPAQLPTLFDADGLKLLNRIDRWWTLLPEQSVLTPHPGEMAILTGLETDAIQSDRWEIAKDYAQRWGTTLILKGAVTVIASAGKEIFVNPVSDASLATAGSGDVLSGVIGGLMAQGIPALHASVLGTWLHGQAGQIAGVKQGTDISVTAMDILDRLPDAFLKAKEAGSDASLWFLLRI